MTPLLNKLLYRKRALASFCASAVSTTDENSHTFTAHAIGNPTFDRNILVAVFVAGSAVIPTPTVTVGGQSCTQVAGLLHDFNQRRILFFITDAPIAAGTTADVVVACTGSIRYGIATWAVTGLLSRSAFASISDTTNPWAQDIAVMAGGIVLAYADGDLTVTNLWTTPLIERFDQTIESVQTHSGADFNCPTARIVTVIDVPNNVSSGMGLVAVSMR